MPGHSVLTTFLLCLADFLISTTTVSLVIVINCVKKFKCFDDVLPAIRLKEEKWRNLLLFINK